MRTGNTFAGLILTMIFFGLVFTICAGDGLSQGTSRQMMNLQGRAYDQGSPASPLNASYNMTFGIWDTGPGVGGAQLFTETQLNVPVNNGFYNVMLGNATVGGIPATVFQNNNLWLEIAIAGETLAPRTRILSASFAFNADQVDGVDAGSFFQQNGNAFGASGVLGTNDANALIFETNNTERMRIDSAGFAGIGTAPTINRLTVTATAASGIWAGTSGGDGSSAVVGWHTSNAAGSGLSYDQARCGVKGMPLWMGLSYQFGVAGYVWEDPPTSYPHGAVLGGIQGAGVPTYAALGYRTDAATTYGIYAVSSRAGAVNNYGVYGSASGGTVNWAGYFNGNVGLGGTATASQLRLYEPNGSGPNFTAFQAQAQGADVTYTLPPGDGGVNTVLTTNGAGVLSWAAAGVAAHSALTGLVAPADDHTQYALLSGRAAGQTLIGGTANTDDLILRTTSANAVAGADMIFQTGNNGATEAMRMLFNGNVGIGTAAPSSKLTVSSTAGNAIEVTGQINAGMVGLNLSNAQPIVGYGIRFTPGGFGPTTGIGIDLPCPFISTGTGISLGGGVSGGLGNQSGHIINIAPTRDLTSATITDSGCFLRIVRNNSVSNAGATYNCTGALVALTSNNVQTSGTFNDSSNVLAVTQSYANATGTVLNVANSGTGPVAVFTGGNVGVGIATPQSRLDVTGASVYNQDYSRQFAIHDSAIYQKVLSMGFDGTNDVGWIQSTYSGVGYMPLVLNPNRGNVGIFTINPLYKLHVASTTANDRVIYTSLTGAVNGYAAYFTNTGSGIGTNYGVYATASGATTANWAGYFNGNFCATGTVNFTGTAVGPGTALALDGSNNLCWLASSRRYKHDIADYQADIDKINDLRPVSFKWNEDTAAPDAPDFGLIAEEVNEIFPEMVSKDDKGEIRSVDYGKLSVILLKGMQEQQKAIEKLAGEIAQLKATQEKAAGGPSGE
jgi:hypothetical protein